MISRLIGRIFKRAPASIEDMVLADAQAAARARAAVPAAVAPVAPVPVVTPVAAPVVEQKAAVPAPAAGKGMVASGRRITSLVGRGVSFRGDIATRDSVHVSGTVVGNVAAIEAGVSISAGGAVHGIVNGEQVLVGGEVRGQIRAKIVRLYPSAVVEGDIYCERLLIDDGATLIGRSWPINKRPLVVDGVVVPEAPAADKVSAAVVEMPREVRAAAG